MVIKFLMIFNAFKISAPLVPLLLLPSPPPPVMSSLPKSSPLRLVFPLGSSMLINSTRISVAKIKRLSPSHDLSRGGGGGGGTSSVASPICQEGQSERTFPIFAFSSQFFLFFPNFPDFFLNFGNFFAVRDGTLPPPCHPIGYATGGVLTC